MENGRKNKVVEIQKVMEKSWNLSTDHAWEIPIIPGLLQWFGYDRLSVYVLNSKS